MKLILSTLLLASAAAAQSTAPPPVPNAVTPDDANLPVRKTKGAYSELEGVGNTTEDGVMGLGKYQGGSWSVKPNRVTAYANRKEIVLRQSKQRFAIAVTAVTEVIYGAASQSRVAQDTGIAALKTSAAGGATDVGIVWTETTGKGGIVLKLDKGDFDNYMNALESVTGLKASR